MHSLIVALLCLTLFVDTAKACWLLRHRTRSHTCRPVACRPSCPPPCSMACADSAAVIIADQPCCLSDSVVSTLTDTDDAAVEPSVVEPNIVEHGAVVHGPTVVMETAPSASVPVVTAPAVQTPTAPAAQPLVIAASPAVPQTAVPAQEPLPDLKPAVARASNEQPMPEASAAADVTAKETPADEPPAAEELMLAETAPVEDLAGGPAVPAAVPEPQEPNLFDLYDDEVAAGESDEVMPADEPLDEQTDATPDASADEATASDEEEMAEDESEPEDSDAADSEATESAEPAADASEEDAAEQDDDADAPSATEADPFAATFAVPSEPMRRWSNDTNTHHTQGWLVELRADRVRILKVNGRHTTVAIESLSNEDRTYVSAVGDRLAAERQGTSPAPSTTAGL
jgi:hypothetical protein